MAEILRVLEVPQLPATELPAQVAKDLTFYPEPAPKYMRLSYIETMASPMNQNTSLGGLLQAPQEQNTREAMFREGLSGLEPELTDRTDRAFEDLINIILISLDLRDPEADSESQQEVQLVRESSDPIDNVEHLKLLSTDVSPSARSLLNPGYIPSSRNYSPPRRSIFSGTGSSLSDVINDSGKNK